MSTGFYISMDSSSTTVMSSTPTLQFYQVTDSKTYGNACLLATCNLKYVLEVTEETDSCYSACRIVHIRASPCTITNACPLPTNIPSSMLFFINCLETCRYKCLLESKKYRNCVLDVYTGSPSEGTRMICHPNWNDNRDNQVFLLDKKPQEFTC